MNVIELLQGQLDENVIHQLSNQIGADSDEQTKAAANGIISTLVAGLNKNAATPDGANALTSALDRDHDGSILDDVAGFVLGNRQPSNASTLNGAGILGHVLGGKQSGVVDMISKATGLDSGQIMKLMISLAPMVLGALGKFRSQQSGGSVNISDLLSGTVRSQTNTNSQMGFLNRFLDSDGDGSIMDDVADMGMKFFLHKK